jgi:hypothetical protein
MSVNDTYGIVIDDSRVTLQMLVSLAGNSIGVIYNRNVFIVQATYLKLSAGNFVNTRPEQ